MGAPIPRRTRAHGGGVVLALALLWVLPGFAAERLIERAVDNDDPAAARLAATLSPFDPAPLRLAARLEAPGAALQDALAATGAARTSGAPGRSSRSSRGRQGARRPRVRPRA